METLIIMSVIAMFLSALFWAMVSGNKQRRKALSGLVAPLGFDVLSKFDEESADHFHQHKPMMGLMMNVKAVCVADSGSIRIVVMEYHVRDRKSTRLNSSHEWISRMPSSA